MTHAPAHTDPSRMITLTPDESRVLGVLIEKSTTTPDQYPLSLNAVVAGANQKNNRDPVTTMTDDTAFDALESLRAKSLVVRIEAGAGSRVHRFRHNATDVLHVRAGELAILAELLLRGPQTQGELRGRASRMAPMDTLEIAREMLRALMTREEPLVRELPPAPGSRAERYAQLLCPDLHDVEVPRETSGTSPAPQTSPGAPAGVADRVAKLESEMAELRSEVRRLSAALGEGERV